jgi:hypothetical protein
METNNHPDSVTDVNNVIKVGSASFPFPLVPGKNIMRNIFVIRDEVNDVLFPMDHG